MRTGNCRDSGVAVMWKFGGDVGHGGAFAVNDSKYRLLALPYPHAISFVPLQSKSRYPTFVRNLPSSVLDPLFESPSSLPPVGRHPIR
jgi:hypothetical protein